MFICTRDEQFPGQEKNLKESGHTRTSSRKGRHVLGSQSTEKKRRIESNFTLLLYFLSGHDMNERKKLLLITIFFWSCCFHFLVSIPSNPVHHSSLFLSMLFIQFLARSLVWWSLSRRSFPVKVKRKHIVYLSKFLWENFTSLLLLLSLTFSSFSLLTALPFFLRKY